jgi:hypothetical protein
LTRWLCFRRFPISAVLPGCRLFLGIPWGDPGRHTRLQTGSSRDGWLCFLNPPRLRSCSRHHQNKTYGNPHLTTVALFWRFFLFHCAIRIALSSRPAATTRRTSGIDWTGRSRVSDPTMDSHRLARLGWPLDCMQPNCQRERGLSPRTGKPALQVWCKLHRVVPVIRGGISGLLRVVRELAASNSDRPCVACP